MQSNETQLKVCDTFESPPLWVDEEAHEAVKSERRLAQVAQRWWEHLDVQHRTAYRQCLALALESRRCQLSGDVWE